VCRQAAQRQRLAHRRHQRFGTELAR
jgi:hypothetical protein